MVKNLFIVFLLFFQLQLFGQVGGKSIYQFLNLMTSPRQAAMGGKNDNTF